MKFKHSVQKFDFTKAYCQVLNNDATTIEPISKNYAGLDRTKIKAINVIADGKIIYTLQIKGNKFVYRLRNIARTFGRDDDPVTSKINFANPKRGFLLETKGKIVFIWDSGEIKELTAYGDISQYKAPVLTENDQ
jgi:hypothetical protein